MRASLFKRGRLYHAKVKLDAWADEKRISLGTTDKRVASIELEKRVKEFEQIEAGLLAPRSVRNAAEQALPSLHEAFLSAIEESVSVGTIKKYAAALRSVLAVTGWKRLPQFTEAAMRDWQRESPLRAKTRNDYLAAWYRFGRWLKRSRLTTENPCEFIDPVDVHKTARVYRRQLTGEEVARLLAVSPHPRSLIYRLVLETGLRRSELRQLRVGEFNLRVAPAPHTGAPCLEIALGAEGKVWGDGSHRGSSAVLVPASTAKHRKSGLLALNETTAAELRAFFGDAAPFAKPFAKCIPRVRTIKRDLAAAGIPFLDALDRRADFHSLRGTHGTALVLSGAEPRVVMEAMRHSDLKLTMKTYMDAAQLQGPVAAAVAKLPWQRETPLRRAEKA